MLKSPTSQRRPFSKTEIKKLTFFIRDKSQHQTLKSGGASWYRPQFCLFLLDQKCTCLEFDRGPCLVLDLSATDPFDDFAAPKKSTSIWTFPDPEASDFGRPSGPDLADPENSSSESESVSEIGSAGSHRRRCRCG